MSVERKQSLFIIVYAGKESADSVYHTLRTLEKQDKIDIKTAATIYRENDGTLRLKHRQRLTLWKNEFDVGSIGLILAGTRAGTLADAVVDALMGTSYPKQRRAIREFLDDNLGPNDSGLVILTTDSEWEAVQSEVDHFGGEELVIELSAKAEKRLAEIAADEEVAAAVHKEVKIEKVTL